MRRFLCATLLSLMPGLAFAGPLDLSHEIRDKGLQATQSRLAALNAPTGEEAFALAGLRFLGAVEQALQLRWQVGLEADWSELPILRLPIPPNPEAREMQGQDITALIAGVTTGMDEARAALGQVGNRDFGLEIDLADLWFDINANGQRDPGEAIADVAVEALGLWGLAPEPGQIVIRFDGSDAAWLTAYTHLISGTATVFQAYDPGPAIDRILQSTRDMHALWGETPPPNAWDMMFGKQVDRVTIILQALAQEPDAALAAKAHGHFLAMIEENRRFWSLVEAETDNDREWIPNEKQVSALGLQLPPGTGAQWQAVLADAEKLLKGEILMPHWRYGAEAGISLKKLFEAPPKVDLIGMIQGEALLPYAEKGVVMSGQAWSDFERLMQGDAVLFAVLFN
ncbi:hypothetical protein [Rhodobacter sp. 24-YEA-8]|uniref:hypothetical protein n=1 Tax=Rhodobacter sp. 24-YEA-8 TaxID=1884310 RepID=UPI00089D3324|nr:hypothetical protein [Rhodobacter sp. 24-YEA-8]SEC80810.1 hypothetical protein SAMN05519105_3329 [Rhodobacter sp. 24-YEA-8]